MLQPRLKSVEAEENLTLRLQYETGEIRFFDVKPYAVGDWYGMLLDSSYFKTVHLLPSGVGIEWADGQDIAPHELYSCSVERMEKE